MRNSFQAFLILVCLFSGAIAVRAQSGVRYRVQDLGALSNSLGAYSYATGINSVGQVSGYAQNQNGVFAPFRWTNGAMQDLGTLGNPPNIEFGAWGGINNLGRVTGHSRTSDGRTHAFLFNGTLIDLSGGGAGFPGGQDQTIGRAINNRGDIVGQQGSSVASAFFYDGQQVYNLDNLVNQPGEWRITSALGVNDNRQVVGGSFHNGLSRAYRYTVGGEILDLGVLNPNATSLAFAINNNGDVVGDSNNRGFRYTNATGFLPLGVLQEGQTGTARAINNRGDAVGSSGGYAVFWKAGNAAALDLNSVIESSPLRWVLIEARGINDRGQIVGYGSNLNGFARSFLLTPINPASQIADFDGDGKTDFSVFRPAGGFWYQLRSSTNSFFAQQFGTSSDRLAPGDYDGDGKTDLAVFRDSNWFILNSSNNSFRAVNFGLGSDVPVQGDFDGDGKTDVAVFRPSDGNWYVLRSMNNSFFAQNFGQNGDKPIVGDFDGDAKADLAFFRNGNWFIQQSNAGFRAVNFGISTDKIVASDYDGDGKTDIAVFRPSNGTWYVLQSSNNNFTAFNFGTSTDVPTPGDFDGDGKSDFAVFRNGSWFVQQSQAGFRAVNFGTTNDVPIPFSYISSAN